MQPNELDHAVSELALRQAGVFTLEQLKELGADRWVARRRCSAGRWVRIHGGIYRLRDHPLTWHARLWAAVLEAGPSAAVSHSSAAQLLGVPGWPRDSVEVTKWRGRDHKVVLGRLHETSWLPPAHVRVLQGLPCTSVARCLFDLAGNPPAHLRHSEAGLEIYSKKIARSMNHAMVHLGLTLEKQAEVLIALGKRGRPGTALMRRILTEFGPQHVPTESDLEDLFLEVVRAYFVEEPERQVVLGEERPEGRVDFFYRAHGLVVEVDGLWHDGPLQRAADQRRDAALSAMGLRVLRFRRQDLVRRPALVARVLRGELSERAAA